jgi:glycosyltransferase involved in cell wall biosynthesis
MKVLVITRSQSGVPGGAGVPGGQIGMIQLARALVRAGVDVELFIGGPQMRYLTGLDGPRTRYLRWPVWLDRLISVSPASVRRIGKDLRRRRWLDTVTSLESLPAADVVHVQGLEDTETLLTRIDGPLVVTHWGRLGRWRPDGADDVLRRRIDRIRANATVVAIGEAQGDELAAVGVPPAAVIAPGVDLRHFVPGDRAAARRRTGIPGSDPVVLYVGRLAPDKGVDTLLKAFARLKRQARLLIVGDGPLRAELDALCGTLGIGAATTFVPFVPHHDLPAYYQGCDVMVMPSGIPETFCMAALEAIACGCRVIVTDHVPEIVRRFPQVPSVAPDDAGSLAVQIENALAGKVHPARSERVDDYGWNSVAGRYLDVYRTALRATE